MLDSKSDDYFVTADDFVGFKVLVHRPEAYPEVEGNAIAVGAGREFFVSVSASHTEGSKAILDFPFEGRSCLFNEERNFPNSEVRYNLTMAFGKIGKTAYVRSARFCRLISTSKQN